MIIILHDSYYISPQLFELLPHKYPIYATSITDPNFLFFVQVHKMYQKTQAIWALQIQVGPLDPNGKGGGVEIEN